MTGTALSAAKKRRRANLEQERWMKRAIQVYHEGQAGDRKLGLRTVIKQVEDECFQQTKKVLKLDKTTLSRRVKGGRSAQEFNFSKGWLNHQEENTIVDYILSLAARGWPLSIRRIKEHVDEICAAKYGATFPESGVGKNWVERFLERHHDRLKSYWSRPLDNARARAVNPHNKELFFNLLQETLAGDDSEDAPAHLRPIIPEHIYGADETGIQMGVGNKERVVGSAKGRVQHQQRSGNRENVTAIVTICADGTSIAPAIIFKGDGFQVEWNNENPLGADLAWSKKGYTDGEISVEWIKSFDNATREKAAGRRRLLLVDGHNSHYTRGFLEYARGAYIEVLCYPSHATHVFQGLDVVIFSILKREWTSVRDKFEGKAKGKNKVNKRNFLRLYAEAHINALTKPRILAAFSKTGVVPFNPDVITEAMMAPSIDTSTTANNPLPLPLDEMTQAIVGLIVAEVKKSKHSHSGVMERDNQELQANENMVINAASASSGNTRSRSHSVASFSSQAATTMQTAHQVVETLASSSSAHLLNSSPLRSDQPAPIFLPHPFSPTKNRYEALLMEPAMTEREERLAGALWEAAGREEAQKNFLMGMQATTILQGIYVQKAQEQIQAQEEKAREKQRAGKLHADGTPKYLTEPGFIAQVAAQDEAKATKAAEKADRQLRRQSHSEALREWKKAELLRKNRNIDRRERFKLLVASWNEAKEQAKADGRKFTVRKPKLTGIESGVPRPKMQQTEAESEDGGETEQGNDTEMDDEDD